MLHVLAVHVQHVCLDMLYLQHIFSGTATRRRPRKTHPCSRRSHHRLLRKIRKLFLQSVCLTSVSTMFAVLLTGVIKKVELEYQQPKEPPKATRGRSRMETKKTTSNSNRPNRPQDLTTESDAWAPQSRYFPQHTHYQHFLLSPNLSLVSTCKLYTVPL